MRKTLASVISVLVFLAALSIWELCAIIIPRFGFLFGSPSEIVVAFIRNTANGTLIGGFFVTGMEALTGFVVGVIFGTIAGFLLWYSPLIARIVRPYIVILGAVPVFAFAPMMIIWFGVGFGMKIAMAALGTFLVALTQAYEGAKNVDIEEFRLLRIFGATRFQVFMTVVLPSSLSWVLSSMKLNVGFALLGAFIGEFISSDNGLGHFMIRAGSFYDVSSVFAGGVYLVFLALLFEKMVNLVEKKQKKITEFVSVSRKTRQALKGVREEE